MSASSESSAAYQNWVYAVAYDHARRLRLKHEDAQDCAVAFVQNLLTTASRLRPVDRTSTEFKKWLHRCAHNHACNYLRMLTRHSRAERLWTECFGRAAQQLLQSWPIRTAGPRTLTLRRELWRQMRLAFKQLTPAQRDLFVRYHLREQSIHDLAARYGRTPHAVEESLSHTRKRLAQLLNAQGWSESDIKALFTLR